MDGAAQEDEELLECSWLLLVGSRYVTDIDLLHAFPLLCLQIELVPLLRCRLTLIRELATAVEGFLVDDVEHNFRVDIAASGTSAGFCVGIVGSLLEIGDSIDGVTVEDGIAAFVKQPQTVEELINVAGWLVDVDNDELSF